MKRFVLFCILISALWLVPAPDARACMECECGGIIIDGGRIRYCFPCELEGSNRLTRAPSVDRIEVTFPSKDRALIMVPGYVTTHLAVPGECVVGFPGTDEIEKINAVVNFDSTLKIPFDEVTFAVSEASGSALTDFAQNELQIGSNGPWQALVSTITGEVPDGIPNHFLIDVAMEPGVTPHELVAALREDGIFITASSQGGIPDGGHIFLKRFRDYEMSVIYPSPGGFSEDKPIPSLP